MAKRDWAIGIVTCVLGVALGTFGTYFVNQAQREEDRQVQQCLEEQNNHQKKVRFFEQMGVHLDGSLYAFENQTNARNLLYESLERNHAPLSNVEYEVLFAELHDVFTEEEQAICDLMRGITAGSMLNHNQSMAELIVSNAEFKDELPEFTQLQDHLDLWQDKYRARLEGREESPDVCLVYVGVQEDKPFPSSIDAKVSRMIDDLRGQSRSCHSSD